MRVSLRSFFFGLPILTIIVLTIAWRGMYGQFGDGNTKWFPTINLPILFDSEKRFQKQDLLGSVVLLNFWSSWCMACREEHSTLLWVNKNYPIKIIGINFQDDTSQAKTMLLRYGNPFKMIVEDHAGMLAYTFGINALPQTFLIDKKGKIRYHYIGSINRRLFENTILSNIQELEKE